MASKLGCLLLLLCDLHKSVPSLCLGFLLCKVEPLLRDVGVK